MLAIIWPKDYFCQTIGFSSMKVRNNFTIREIAGATILMPSSVAGKAEVSTVNINGTGLWLLHSLEGREFSADDAVQLLCDRYDITRETAARDAGTLLDALRKCGFLDE